MYVSKANMGSELSGQKQNLHTAHIEYKTIETAYSPLGEVMLRSYAADTGETGYEIRLNGNFLMATHGYHSEMAMARLAHRKLTVAKENLCILIGGLGAGYTLQAALSLENVDHVVVTEVSDKVVEWNKRFFAEHSEHAIDDPRTEIRVENLMDHVTSHHLAYHLILMDVDNGPGWMAAQENEALYDEDGLNLLNNALLPGGVLAVWSPSPNKLFKNRIQKVFRSCEAVDTTSIGRAVHEPGDTIYLGVKA